MRLLFGIGPLPWLIGLGGVFVVSVGYLRGNVAAIGIGVVVVAIALARQFLA
jgi:hypothetical protein